MIKILTFITLGILFILYKEKTLKEVLTITFELHKKRRIKRKEIKDNIDKENDRQASLFLRALIIRYKKGE